LPSIAGKQVLIVSHGFQSAYERGFCNALVDNGAKVKLIASDKTDQSAIRRGIHICNIRGSQDPARSLWKKIVNMVKYHLKLVLLVYETRPLNLHVIGLTDYPVLTGIVEGILFRFCSHNYVLTVHNVLPHGAHNWWNRLVYKRLYRVPHHVIVHTQSMADQLTGDFCIPKERVIVMEHGCEFDKDIVAVDRAKTWPELRILFFGGIAQYKGLDVLLNAVPSLPTDFQLRICGYCRSKSLEADIRLRIKAASAFHVIDWRNEYVSDTAVAESMHWADILVMPYRHIDQSGVIFQALKFGVPVVASRVGELHRLVTADVGETCKPDDSESLAIAINRLARRIDKVSRGAIASNAKRYDWGLTVRAMGNAYA